MLNQGLHKRWHWAVDDVVITMVMVMMFVSSVGGSDGGNCDCDND